MALNLRVRSREPELAFLQSDDATDWPGWFSSTNLVRVLTPISVTAGSAKHKVANSSLTMPCNLMRGCFVPNRLADWTWFSGPGQTLQLKNKILLTRTMCDFGSCRSTQEKSVNQERFAVTEKRQSRSIPVLPSQGVLGKLSRRIEQAYALRRPDWRGGCSTSRLWSAAAERLWAAHASDPTEIPLDAELFVAAQPIVTPFADPWSELAQPEAARRYRSQVRRIVRRLRAELKREVARAEASIGRGRKLSEVLNANGRISALGCFIVAIRAGRGDLAASFVDAASAQHRACPLYRRASLALLPNDLYPVGGSFCGPANGFIF